MFKWILLIAGMATSQISVANDTYSLSHREKVQEFVVTYSRSIQKNFIDSNQMKEQESLIFLERHTQAGLDFLLALHDIRKETEDKNPLFEKEFLRTSEDQAIEGLVSLHQGITLQAKNSKNPNEYVDKANALYFDLIYEAFMKRWALVYQQNQELFESEEYKVDLQKATPDFEKIKKIMAFAAKNDPLLFAYHRLTYEMERNLENHTEEGINDLSFFRNNSLILLSAVGYFAATTGSTESVLAFAAASIAALNTKKLFSRFNPIPNVIESLKTFIKTLTSPQSIQYAFKGATACRSLF